MKDEKKAKLKLNLFKKIIYCCIGVLLFEVILFGITFLHREFKTDYYDGLNDIILVSDGYIGVGSSNFKNNNDIPVKTYTYKNAVTGRKEKIVASQARLVKYDTDMNVVWEKTFDSSYDSVFYNVISVSDGYVAVGSYVYEEEQLSLNTKDGLIVKYDLDGNIVWYKNYQVLGDTEFFKVIQSDDDYIVVGKSIYENMEIGNHYTGGGVIVRYSSDGEVLARNNYGGNKSGLFNDVVEVSDGYIVCGRDASNYGILVKFKKDFNRLKEDENLISDKVLWNYNFENTDGVGFTDMEIINNKIYLTGAFNVSDEKDSEGNIIYQYDAGIAIYDINGNYLSKTTFGGKSLDRYMSLAFLDDYLVVVGTTSSSDIDIPDYPNYSTQTGIIVKYDLEGNLLEKTYYGGRKQDILTRVINVSDNYLVIGSSNSEISFLGFDYKTILNFYNSDLEIQD